MHKRRATGGKKKAWRKKIRKYGRQPANTKLSSNKTVGRIRARGGNVKYVNKAAAALAKKGEEGEAAAASPAEEAKNSNHL
ncbi:hypothetical protein Ddye_010754 [Dipteronia dyeriana]|uniref:Uncharacterized protein n=1 Tax=Dipteronia dyeriana TaxID=168575 RepID=A0AAE0CNJ5_9ROSI|nr:hypothetical protein Ddye_010754 [Dipteronia dyeriana]